MPKIKKVKQPSTVIPSSIIPSSIKRSDHNYPEITDEYWMETSTGKIITPFNFTPRQVAFDDIAHALSNICRFGGHCSKFYSVAQHSVLMAKMFQKLNRYKLARIALLHDASEAYLIDLPTPIKHHPSMIEYRNLECKIQNVIYSAFGISELSITQNQAVIKRADQYLLTLEAETDFVEKTSDEFRSLIDQILADPKIAAFEYHFDSIHSAWSPEDAEDEMKELYEELWENDWAFDD